MCNGEVGSECWRHWELVLSGSVADELRSSGHLHYSPPFLPAQGASANWWNHRHFQHHAKPNIFHKDPDVNMLHVFVLGEWQPVEV